MRVIVVGAGIGGLSTALVLARLGHDVQVLEQAPALKEVGAGLQIGANGSRILHHWDLLQPLLGKASAASFGWLGDGLSGKPLCKFPLSDFAESRYNFPHLQVHRADLLQVLADACAQFDGIQILTDAKVVHVQQTNRQVSCRTEAGGAYQAELLVGADGMRSRVAELVFARPPATFSGKVAWRALVNMDDIDAELDTALPGIWMAPGKHLVHYPIRHGRLLNLVACADSDQRVLASWDNRCSTQQFLDTFGDLAANLQTIMAPLRESYVWGLYEAEEHDWAKGRVVLLGDAAHAMLPSMAQGAVMALEDAAVLGQLLLEYGSADLARVLQIYQQLRAPRVRSVQQAARQNIELFHAPQGMVRNLRFRGMSALGAQTEKIIGRRYDWIYGFDALAEATKAAD